MILTEKSILLTGASGFVGQRYLKVCSQTGRIKAVSLQKTAVTDIDFSGIDTVVHLAGIAHQMQKIDEQIYYDVNHLLTLDFAKKAKSKGVKHFIFMSTVKVYGEGSEKEVIDESTKCIPEDAYGKSKLAAEQDLMKLENEDFKVAIIRPPLVYGPDVKGNMLRLLGLVDKNLPLPLKGINNSRSMVFIDNLISLINKIAEKRATGVFLAADSAPVSTSKLIRTIREKLGKTAIEFKIPPLIVMILSILKPNFIKRLFGSFEIDASYTNTQLNFSPPFSFDEGIGVMVDWYKDKNPQV